MLREEAWIELEMEPPDSEEGLMTDEQFEDEVALASEGRWSELDLDELPDNWEPASMQELRDAG